jgi:integrase/recombinase XerD
MNPRLPEPDLSALLPSWLRALRAEGKAPGTRRSYETGVRLFLRWCSETGTPPELSKATVTDFTASLLDGGAEPATAVSRQFACKRFADWLADEGELGTNPLLGLKPPKLDRKVTPALTDDELKLLIKQCQGKKLVDRRDEAIVRLMAETGMRAGELIGLRVGDVDLDRGLVVIRRGKGGKGRICPFGAQTTAAIDRYLRTARHKLTDATSGPLWVAGGSNTTFGYHGLDRTLKQRAELAGIKGFHLHLLRHTAASRWLRAGGSEGGLMAVAGWSTREMLDRYVASTAAERAAAEARGLNLGDL